MRNHPHLIVGIVLLAASLAALPSCDMEYLSYRRAAGRFLSSTVTLPPVLLRVQGDTAEYVRTDLARPAYVVWFSREDCSTCAVTHLEEKFYYLWRLAGDTDAFDVLYVMSPQPVDRDAIVALIRAHDFAWPVYVDEDGAMAAALPEDPRLHVFLMGADGKPVWIGNPVGDGKVDEEFLEILE